VSLRKPGPREVIFGNVVVRSGKGHSLEVHLDTDEANAAMLSNGDLLEIIK
jgi:putative phosphotransacetylase